jgi:hypothetical protein
MGFCNTARERGGEPLAKEFAMLRTTIMTTAMVLGASIAASANAAEFQTTAGYWPTTSGWSSSYQREQIHQRYLTPAEHQALHRGLNNGYGGLNNGYGSRSVLPSRTYPYGSSGSVRLYDPRHLPAWRTPTWSTWAPTSTYPYGGGSYYPNGAYYR